ncbi:hypothetical protein ABWI13_30810 [Streptomyces koyangensis]|uniref:hypothetical protein n=1 Tax=Streptomyces TaxID=1883 RepID=UPI0033779D4A
MFRINLPKKPAKSAHMTAGAALAKQRERLANGRCEFCGRSLELSHENCGPKSVGWGK